MKTFFDLMQDAQRGAMTNLMAKEFGVSAEQQAKAFEALMPAFWLGMTRNQADPFGVAAFWQSFGSGQFKPYFDNPFMAATPSAVAEGNKLLEGMFGSPEIARAVSLQVEAATGIAQDVVRRMMPVVANVMMGGLQRQSEQAGNPFLRFMQDMGKMQDVAKPKKTPDLPFVAMMEAFLGKEPEKEPEPEEPMTQEEVIDRMFDAGRSMQDNYFKSLERIFDQFGSKPDAKEE